MVFDIAKDAEVTALKNLLNEAVLKVYAERPSLFAQEGLEQAIAFRTGMYLHGLMNADSAYADLNLDCEYNKSLDDVKRTPNYPNGIRPDILIHKRGNHVQNKIAVEFKGWWNRDRDDDIQKLKDLTNPEYDYKYILGCLVSLQKATPVYHFFIAGEEEGGSQ